MLKTVLTECYLVGFGFLSDGLVLNLEMITSAILKHIFKYIPKYFVALAFTTRIRIISYVVCLNLISLILKEISLKINDHKCLKGTRYVKCGIHFVFNLSAPFPRIKTFMIID